MEAQSIVSFRLQTLSGGTWCIPRSSLRSHWKLGYASVLLTEFSTRGMWTQDLALDKPYLLRFAYMIFTLARCSTPCWLPVLSVSSRTTSKLCKGSTLGMFCSKYLPNIFPVLNEAKGYQLLEQWMNSVHSLSRRSNWLLPTDKPFSKPLFLHLHILYSPSILLPPKK